MNALLVFFALPVATIILAIVLQKILRCPLLVAATFFAIFLIVTFAAFDASFLVFAILYTILAYVTAVLTKVICHFIRILQAQNNCSCNNNGNCNEERNGNGIARISERPITINSTSPTTSINLASDANLLTCPNTNNTGRRTNCNCCCNCGRR